MRHLVSRSSFLRLCFSAATGFFVDCVNKSEQDELGRRRDQALRVLPSEIRRLFPTNSQVTRPTLETVTLLEFLAEAHDNQTLDQSKPVVLSSPSLDMPSVRPLELQEEIDIVTKRLYTWFPTDVSRRVLLVCTAKDSEFELPAVADAVETFKTTMPKVDAFLGFLFQHAWLHVEFWTDGVVARTYGFNLLIPRGGESFPEVMAHEVVHMYDFAIAAAKPVFIVEGIADAIAEIVTGRPLYSGYATNAKIHLKLTVEQHGQVFLEEAANGLAFFRDLISLIGIDRFKNAVRMVFKKQLRDGIEILRELKAWAPNPARVEALYVQRIGDYVAGAS